MLPHVPGVCVPTHAGHLKCRVPLVGVLLAKAALVMCRIQLKVSSNVRRRRAEREQMLPFLQ